jgi:hypothetical protein
MTVCIGEKLDITWQLEKCEQIVDIWHNVRFTHSSVHTICRNADRITENAKSGTEVFVKQDYHSPIGMNHTKNYGCESLTFLLQ